MFSGASAHEHGQGGAEHADPDLRRRLLSGRNLHELGRHRLDQRREPTPDRRQGRRSRCRPTPARPRPPAQGLGDQHQIGVFLQGSRHRWTKSTRRPGSSTLWWSGCSGRSRRCTPDSSSRTTRSPSGRIAWTCSSEEEFYARGAQRTHTVIPSPTVFPPSTDTTLSLRYHTAPCFVIGGCVRWAGRTGGREAVAYRPPGGRVSGAGVLHETALRTSYARLRLYVHVCTSRRVPGTRSCRNLFFIKKLHGIILCY